jgi:peptidyl-prolyl cis-trans isomerase SurA
MPGLVVSMPPSSGAPPPSMPGLVVSTPPSAPGGPPPSAPGLVVSQPPPVGARPATAPPAAAPASQAKPKPPPKKLAGPDPGAQVKKAPQGIAALVNDEPVTAYQVDRLARFMVLSTNIADRARANMKAIAEDPRTNERLKEILQETIKANQGKTREQVVAIFEERKKQFVIGLQKQAVEGARSSSLPSLRKKALDELIDERLKFQEAKRLSVVVSDDDADRAFKGVAERNKVSIQDFMANIRAQGADPEVMKGRLKTQLLWREVIKRRFGHTIAVSNREIDQLVQSSKGGEDQVELQLQKITVQTSGKIDQKVMAQRFAEAEGLRGRFGGCKTMAGLGKDVAGAKFEDLGFRKAATVAEPTRSLLMQAKDGEMAPATLTAAGVELYAVCGRRVVKADEQKRQAAENELQFKEFERIAERHLQDLRKDALIEIR